MVVDFADLPVNLRQEILNLIHNRNISSPTLTITGLGMFRPAQTGPMSAQPIPQADGHTD